jgi:hypothetical protein
MIYFYSYLLNKSGHTKIPFFYSGQVSWDFHSNNCNYKPDIKLTKSFAAWRFAGILASAPGGFIRTPNIEFNIPHLRDFIEARQPLPKAFGTKPILYGLFLTVKV